MNRKLKKAFETEIFCNIINVFTVTFDQFSESLLNKSIAISFISKFRRVVYSAL